MDSPSQAGSSSDGGIVALLSPFASAASRTAQVTIDWPKAWHFCSFHGVRPAFVQALGEPGQDGPQLDWLAAELADFSKKQAFWALQNTSEIVGLTQALETAGIPAVFFKGAVLGEQVYGGAQGREFNDIDLLVAPDERERVAALLEALGYEPMVANRHFRQTFFDYAGQHMFRNRGTGSVVDLHWNFVGPLQFPVTDSEVLRNRTMLQIGGARVPAPCREDLALILAGHGQKEGWASFGWALDFAKFAARFPDFHWTRAADRAEASGSLRPVLTAILLVERLFGHAIDAGLANAAREQPQIVEDVERIVARHYALTRRRLEDDLMGSFRLCETRFQRVKVWFGLLTTRTIGDYEALPLPPRWWWVYRVTRPFRLAWQKISGKIPTPSAFLEAQRSA